MAIATKRAYEKPDSGDGYRVLVDGLWPRRLTNEKLKVAEWLRGVAPSASLQKWYGHKPERWEEFRKKLRAELAKSPGKELLEGLVGRARREKLTSSQSATPSGVMPRSSRS